MREEVEEWEGDELVCVCERGRKWEEVLSKFFQFVGH